VRHRHPANVTLVDQRDLGQRAADAVAGAIGSWRFICIQTTVIVIWITLNVTALAAHWDAYPFILLNLAFSTQAAYAAPLLQLSQNRQSEHDRQRAEADYATDAQALTAAKASLVVAEQVHALLVRQVIPALNPAAPAAGPSQQTAPLEDAQTEEGGPADE